MSLYHYSQPTATQQFRRNTEKHAAMAGVTCPTKRCSCCQQHKAQTGGTLINRKFVCAGCRDA